MIFPLANKKPKPVTTRLAGDAAEALARQHLLHAGLVLLERNYRTPGRGGGEIDLILRAPDGTCVFVEVRQRKTARQRRGSHCQRRQAAPDHFCCPALSDAVCPPAILSL